MFTLFDLKNSVPLTPQETAAVWHVLDDYSRTAAGAWLRGFPVRSFELRWCPAMTDAVMGAFVPSRPRTNYLRPEQTGMAVSTTWAEIMTPTVIHELRHAWQFMRCPWLYVLCALPVLREYTLEVDAGRIGREAETIVENMLGWHDGLAFERKRREKTDSDSH